MASDFCPICNTFSSSSNTTLNAHIDQCLPKESTAKFTTMDSKLSRHKIKPRKTRLMVDIYATAKPCTLDGLDRRNGSNWGLKSIIPSESTRLAMAGEPASKSLAHHDNSADVGVVNIDANGAEVRMSSNSDAPLPSEVLEEPRLVTKTNKGNGNEFDSPKKKRKNMERYQKCLKFAPESKKICSRVSRNSQVLGHEKMDSKCEGTRQEDGDVEKSKLLGALSGWARSKRTSLAKKLVMKSGQEPSRCRVYVAQDDKFDQSHLRDLFVHKTSNQKLSDLSKGPVSFTKNDEKTSRHGKDIQANERKEQSPGTKRASFECGSRIRDGSFRSFPQSKTRAGKLSEECSSNVETTGNHVTCLYNKTTRNHVDHHDNLPVSPGVRTKATETSNALVIKDKEALNYRGKVSLPSRSPLFESKSKLPRKYLAFKKSQLTSIAEMDEQKMLKPSHLGKKSKREEAAGKTSPERKRVNEIEEETAVEKGEAIAPIGTLHKHTFHVGSQSIPSSLAVNDALPSLFCEPKSHRNKFGFDEEMLLSDDYGISGPNPRAEEEHDCEFGSQSSFHDFDSIPTLGPPGSFLPSPRRTDSEDLQANLSLTTSRVMSYINQDNLVYGDSSNSHLHAITSTISNSAKQNKVSSCLSRASAMLSSENVATFSQTTSKGEEKITSEKESPIFDRFNVEKGTPGHKIGDQPGQREEIISKDLTLNNCDSQLFKQHDTASVEVPDQDISANTLEAIPETLTVHGSGSEIFPSDMKAMEDMTPMKDSPDVGVKFSEHSQSTTNSVFRLMGKDLMVVRKVEGADISLTQAQTCVPSNHHSSQSSIIRVPTSETQLQGHNFFNHAAPQGSAIFNHDTYKTGGEPLDARLAGQLSVGIIQKQITSGSFSTLLEPKAYKRDCNLPAPENENLRRLNLNVASAYFMEDATIGSECQLENAF